MADFKLDEGEAERFVAWNKEHLEKFHGGVEPYSGAIGGRVTFLVTNTSIGQFLAAKCGFVLGDPEHDNPVNLTDFDLL